MKVRDLMNSEIVTLRRETELMEIFAVMLQYKQNDFPVVDGDYRLVGMLYEENISKPIFERFRKRAGGEAPDYASFQVLMDEGEFTGIRADQMMSSEDSGVAMDVDIVRAGAIMSARKVRHLAVIADDRVVGMISDSSIFLQLMRLAGAQTERHAAESKDSKLSAPPPVPPSVHERRKFERQATSLKVAYKLADMRGKTLSMTGHFCNCINVSLGGMLLDVDELLPLKQLIVMAFEIPGSGVPIKRLARVTRVLPGDAPGHYQMGIMFLALSVEETMVMEQLLKTLKQHRKHG